MYQALYRKYRPKSFDDVVGQDYVITTLKNSIINNKVSHAYMFFGPRGIGKTTIAKIFARAVNCENSSDGNACGKCSNCLKSAENECVDIIEIDAASNNGVDEIREIKSKVSLVPAELKYKVYIIDEVHMLTSGAFNALLKTLEEPPKHVIFILATTDPQKVSETIISRCQCYSFKRISVQDNMTRLKYVADKENINIEENVLEQISIYSNGGLRDSLGLLDKLSSYKNDIIVLDDFYFLNDMISENNVNDFVNNVIEKNVENVISLLSSFNSGGKNIIEIMNQILFFLRRIIVDYYTDNNQKNIDISRYIELANLINEKMFDIKKTSMPYIYVEILLLNYMASGDKNISREINSSSSNVEKTVKLSDSTDNRILNADITNSAIVTDVATDNKLDLSNKVDNSDTKDILNRLYDIMKIRVNNTFAGASKSEKNSDEKLIISLNDYVFDQNIGYIASEILNGTLCASSSDYIIICYEYKSIVDQNLLNLDKITEVYNKLTNSNKKIAFITKSEWENLKKEYIQFTKSGKKYKIEVEPDVSSLVEKNDISNEGEESIFADFGDIVEIK